MNGSLILGNFDVDDPSAMATVVNTNESPAGTIRNVPNTVGAPSDVAQIGTARGGLGYIDQNVGGYSGTRPDLTAGPTGGIRPVRSTGRLTGGVIAAAPSLGVVDQGYSGSRRRNTRARALSDTDVASPQAVTAAFVNGD